MSMVDTFLGLVMGAVVIAAKDRYKEHQSQVKDTRAKLDRVIDRLQVPQNVVNWHDELDVCAGQMISQAISLGVAPELIELMQALRKALGQCRFCRDLRVEAKCESCDITRWAQANGCYVQAYCANLTPRVRIWRVQSPCLWLEKRLLRTPITHMTQELDRVVKSAIPNARP